MHGVSSGSTDGSSVVVVEASLSSKAGRRGRESWITGGEAWLRRASKDSLTRRFTGSHSEITTPPGDLNTDRPRSGGDQPRDKTGVISESKFSGPVITQRSLSLVFIHHAKRPQHLRIHREGPRGPPQLSRTGAPPFGAGRGSRAMGRDDWSVGGKFRVPWYLAGLLTPIRF